MWMFVFVLLVTVGGLLGLMGHPAIGAGTALASIYPAIRSGKNPFDSDDYLCIVAVLTLTIVVVGALFGGFPEVD